MTGAPTSLLVQLLLLVKHGISFVGFDIDKGYLDGAVTRLMKGPAYSVSSEITNDDPVTLYWFSSHKESEMLIAGQL
jgi:hypothetical protein